MVHDRPYARNFISLILFSEQLCGETGIYTGWLTYPVVPSRQLREPGLESRQSDSTLKFFRPLYLAWWHLPGTEQGVGGVESMRHGTCPSGRPNRRQLAWSLSAAGKTDQSHSYPWSRLSSRKLGSATQPTWARAQIQDSNPLMEYERTE